MSQKVKEARELYRQALKSASTVELARLATLPQDSKVKTYLEAGFILGSGIVAYLTDPLGSIGHAILTSATAAGLCVAANVVTQDTSREALGELATRAAHAVKPNKEETTPVINKESIEKAFKDVMPSKAEQEAILALFKQEVVTKQELPTENKLAASNATKFSK